MSYHHDQMNLCRFYGPLGMSIMAEGLRLKELDPRYAYGIAEVIWKKAAEDNLSLSTAYSQILKASTAHIVAEQDEDNWSPPTQCEDRGEDDALDLRPVCIKEPLPCDTPLCEGDRWRQVLMKGNEYYATALNKTKGLHRWCEGRWGDEHMSYGELLEFKDESLTQIKPPCILAPEGLANLQPKPHF